MTVLQTSNGWAVVDMISHALSRSVTPLALAAMLLAAPAQAMTEREYQPLVCPGMELEHVLPDGARVDCLSDTHAIEVDFSEKWAEGLGQALYYAARTGKVPAIILI